MFTLKSNAVRESVIYNAVIPITGLEYNWEFGGQFHKKSAKSRQK